MPTKRAILAELTSYELRAVVDGDELSVADRRVKAQLVDAVARSRRARIAEILSDLSRDRLKELCRAFDLDDSGRKKADLVARLVGPAGATTTAASAASEADSAPEASEPEPANLLSVTQLERYLWSAADILRGSIDSSDYKSYIFGLLFLKRLSDRFEEEAEKLLEKGMPEDVAWTEPDEHQFFVDDRARWGAIQKQATNIGETLNKACAALEERNPALEGVLAGIDYNDERRLGDAKNRDTVLARLVQHFSQVSLRNDRMAEPDLLGRAYEYLIEQFADDAGKKGGEFADGQVTAVETSAVTWGGTELSYTIHRSARRKKTVAVTVDPAGSILVVAPERVATDRLDTIVTRKAEWLARRIKRAESYGPLLLPREFVSGESVRYLGRHYRLKVNAGTTGSAKLRGSWLHVPAPGGSQDAAHVRAALVSWFRRRAVERLPERVEAWHAKAGVPMPRVIVASQRKRWGSCDHSGTIRLNWRIIQAPMRLIDYVVVHELVHLRHRGHGRDYWQAVGRVMPDYERRRRDLRERGAFLVW